MDYIVLQHKKHLRCLIFFVHFLQTERDGQDEEPERLRGETDCVRLVQYGKKDLLQPKTRAVFKLF